MDINRNIVGLVAILGACSVAMAAKIESIIPQTSEFRPVISIQGGYASINTGDRSHGFMGIDDDVFTYTDSGNDQNKGFIGAFIGIEHALPWLSRPGFFMQAGVEYNYFGGIDINGINTVGIEPETSTLYRYDYRVDTQHVLGTLKILSTVYDQFHPYGEAGLGVAFNRSREFNISTTDTGNLNVTPSFDHNLETEFSFILGLGVEADVMENLRGGLGYRYSHFGPSSFDNGVIIVDQFQSPVPFALGTSNIYANQLIARISYVA